MRDSRKADKSAWQFMPLLWAIILSPREQLLEMPILQFYSDYVHINSRNQYQKPLKVMKLTDLALQQQYHFLKHLFEGR